MVTTMMYSEAFPSSPMRHCFFDLKQGLKNSTFLQISCSEKQRDGSFIRNRIIIFLEHMPNFIEALTSICHHGTYLKLHVPKSEKDNVAGPKTLNLFSAPLPDPTISPIERMKKTGASSLADEELVSLLFSAGLTDEQSIGLAREVLKECGGLKGLSKAKARKLKAVDEIGNIRSSALLAVFEIARRLNSRDSSASPSSGIPT
jgi:hypothetical protein